VEMIGSHCLFLDANFMIAMKWAAAVTIDKGADRKQNEVGRCCVDASIYLYAKMALCSLS
jgi:hypothetical protein